MVACDSRMLTMDGNDKENTISKVLAVLAAAIGLILLFMAGESHFKSTTTAVITASPPAVAPAPAGALLHVDTGSVVMMKTTKGTVKLVIFEKDAPVTSKNFLDLVDRGFYDGLTFHRYEPGFVIQGGDPTGTGTGGFVDPKTGKTKTVPLEVCATLSHEEVGTLGMARSTPDSGSSQFYITLSPHTSFLDGKYSVFGKVLDGIGTVRQLRRGDRIVSIKRAGDAQ